MKIKNVFLAILTATALMLALIGCSGSNNSEGTALKDNKSPQAQPQSGGETEETKEEEVVVPAPKKDESPPQTKSDEEQENGGKSIVLLPESLPEGEGKTDDDVWQPRVIEGGVIPIDNPGDPYVRFGSPISKGGRKIEVPIEMDLKYKEVFVFEITIRHDSSLKDMQVSKGDKFPEGWNLLLYGRHPENSIIFAGEVNSIATDYDKNAVRIAGPIATLSFTAPRGKFILDISAKVQPKSEQDPITSDEIKQDVITLRQSVEIEVK